MGLKLTFKPIKLGSFRICDGNPFHSLGAAAKKARSPNARDRFELTSTL